LGSDVPFFLQIAEKVESPACIVTGRGEILKSLPRPPPFGVLLVFPGFASEPGAAYTLLDSRRKLPAEMQRGTLCRPSGRGFTESMEINASWPPPETWNFYNDFQELFLCCGTEQERKNYSAILKALQNAGAAFTGLSGSGSTCFGIFHSIKAAEKARNLLPGTFFTFQTTFLLRS
jgi:4-diphosphocytidyl-2-C-methyl-D-erythritol kinase